MEINKVFKEIIISPFKDVSPVELKLMWAEIKSNVVLDEDIDRFLLSLEFIIDGASDYPGKFNSIYNFMLEQLIDDLKDCEELLDFISKTSKILDYAVDNGKFEQSWSGLISLIKFTFDFFTGDWKTQLVGVSISGTPILIDRPRGIENKNMLVSALKGKVDLSEVEKMLVYNRLEVHGFMLMSRGVYNEVQAMHLYHRANAPEYLESDVVYGNGRSMTRNFMDKRLIQIREFGKIFVNNIFIEPKVESKFLGGIMLLPSVDREGNPIIMVRMDHIIGSTVYGLVDLRKGKLYSTYDPLILEEHKIDSDIPFWYWVLNAIYQIVVRSKRSTINWEVKDGIELMDLNEFVGKFMSDIILSEVAEGTLMG